MSIYTTKTLKLTLDTTSAECQLSTAQLSDTSSPEELTSFCGVHKVAGVPAYELALSGWQDYGQAQSVCDLIHTAYVTDPISDLDVVLTVDDQTRTFTAKPTADIPFGGDAGILTFDTTLSVTSDIADGVVTVP